VAVDHEVDAVAVDAAAREVSQLPDAEEVAARVQRDAVFAGEPLSASTFAAMGSSAESVRWNVVMASPSGRGERR
jgi:hypothetical protein